MMRLAASTRQMASAWKSGSAAYSSAPEGIVNKGDLAKVLADAANITQVQAKAAVDGVMDTIVNAVARGRYCTCYLR